MSVLIKGMAMPPSCYFCGLTDTSFVNCEAFNPRRLLDYDCEERRPDWCPLVEVKNPHGRLIDADALIKALIRKEPFSDCARVVIAECMEEVRHAPTVIEAEDENAD